MSTVQITEGRTEMPYDADAAYEVRESGTNRLLARTTQVDDVSGLDDLLALYRRRGYRCELVEI